MKQRKIHSLLLIGVITLVSGVMVACTKDLGLDDKDRIHASDKYVTFNVDGSADDVTTRGSQASASSLTAGFGVSASVYPSSGTYTNYAGGNYFYKIMARPNTATSYFWPTSDYRISFYAYYPYASSSFTVQSSESANGAPVYAYVVPESIASQLDIMTTQRTNMACTSVAPVSLSFEHRCSDIRFSVHNQSYQDLTLKSISIYGVKYSGTLTESTWTLTGSVNSSSSHPFTLSPNRTITAGSTVDVTGTSNHFLMIPQTIPAGTALIVAITTENGQDKTYTHTLPANFTWEQGNAYTYTLILGDGDMVVYSNITIGNWSI